MKITGGKFRGRIIKTLPGKITRPILSRIRKSLFDIIAPLIRESRFLDLYAGTGSVGIEALSREAAGATFVEREKRAIGIIRENLRNLDLEKKARIYQGDAIKAIKELGKEKIKFDLIFLGPPYFCDIWKKIFFLLKEAEMLDKNGLIIAQHHYKEKMPAQDFSLIKQRRYGITMLSFFESSGISINSDAD